MVWAERFDDSRDQARCLRAINRNWSSQLLNIKRAAVLCLKRHWLTDGGNKYWSKWYQTTEMDNLSLKIEWLITEKSILPSHCKQSEQWIHKTSASSLWYAVQNKRWPTNKRHSQANWFTLNMNSGQSAEIFVIDRNYHQTGLSAVKFAKTLMLFTVAWKAIPSMFSFLG